MIFVKFNKNTDLKSKIASDGVRTRACLHTSDLKSLPLDRSGTEANYP